MDCLKVRISFKFSFTVKSIDVCYGVFEHVFLARADLLNYGIKVYLKDILDDLSRSGQMTYCFYEVTHALWEAALSINFFHDVDEQCFMEADKIEKVTVTFVDWQFARLYLVSETDRLTQDLKKKEKEYEKALEEEFC